MVVVVRDEEGGRGDETRMEGQMEMCLMMDGVREDEVSSKRGDRVDGDR